MTLFLFPIVFSPSRNLIYSNRSNLLKLYTVKSVILTPLQSLMVNFICLMSSSLYLYFWHFNIKLIPLSPPAFPIFISGIFPSYTTSKTSASFLFVDTSIYSYQVVSCFTFQLVSCLLLSGKYYYFFKGEYHHIHFTSTGIEVKYVSQCYISSKQQWYRIKIQVSHRREPGLFLSSNYSLKIRII